eukprot:6124832-Pyramimonas_sp.AAC.1
MHLRGLCNKRWLPWTSAAEHKSGTSVSWIARILLCYKPYRRKAKLNELVPFMRRDPRMPRQPRSAGD